MSDTKTATLKPCPFCGHEPSFSEPQWRDDNRYVASDIECCAKMTVTIGWNLARDMTRPAIEAELRKKAAEQWNVRALTNDEKKLRRMLCVHRHGHLAYMDDGEASFGGDEFCRAIDYMSESPEAIEQAWRDASIKRATPRCSCCGTTENLHADAGSGGPWRCNSPDCVVF